MQTSLFEQEVQRADVVRVPRPRQLSAIASVYEAIREGHKHIVLQAPPGFGKTLIAAHLIAASLRKGRRPLFTCPAISLVDQTLASFEMEGIHDIGVMQAQHSRTNHNATVQIASIQTLLRRSSRNFGLVLPDECHEQFEDFNALLASEEWAKTVVIGLSATPWSRGLGLHYSKLVIGATFRDMMADGLAREYTIYGPPRDIDRDGIGTSKGEFEEAGAAAAMSDATIVGDVLKEWKERSTGHKTFAFCVNRAHATKQMEAFQDDGIPFGYIDANTPVGESDADRGSRKHIFAQMQHGEIAGIASVGCLIRGVDEIVYNILDLQPTKSEIRHVQKWGRMRTSDPNAVYIGLDHAGNNAALGLFTDIHHDTLDTRQPGDRSEAFKDDDKVPKPRKCPKCHTLIPPGARNCPTCHERMPLLTGVTVKDGRLVEMRPLPKPTKEQQAWFSELLWMQRKAGHRDGWVAHQFEEKFGLLPKSLQDVKMRGKKPTPEVTKFVREKRKAYLAAKPVTMDSTL